MEFGLRFVNLYKMIMTYLERSKGLKYVRSRPTRMAKQINNVNKYVALFQAVALRLEDMGSSDLIN